jgi:hypothetical protein
MHSWRVWVLAHAELGTAVFHYSLPKCSSTSLRLDYAIAPVYNVCKYIRGMQLLFEWLHLTHEKEALDA